MKYPTLEGNKPSSEAIALAKYFHDTYEDLAPMFGYETRKETRKFDPESPNGRLMVAVCQSLFDRRVIRAGLFA